MILHYLRKQLGNRGTAAAQLAETGHRLEQRLLLLVLRLLVLQSLRLSILLLPASLAAQATARARGLERPARGGRRPRQAPQDGRNLPPQHVPHNLAEQSAAGRSAIGSSTEAVASGNADALPRKTCSSVHERCSCDSTLTAAPPLPPPQTPSPPPLPPPRRRRRRRRCKHC